MAKTYSCILVGMDVHLVEIEAILGAGFSGLHLLGLPTNASRDMRERVRSALEAIGMPIPARRVVVSVSMPELLKLTRTPLSYLDFPVAACIIRAFFAEQDAQNTLYEPSLECLAGELSLAAYLKPLADDLVYEFMATTHKTPPTIGLPLAATKDKKPQFEYYEGLRDWIERRKHPQQAASKDKLAKRGTNPITKDSPVAVAPKKPWEAKLPMAHQALCDLLKQPKAGVAILAAAAGGHHLIFAGEPGVGKSFSVKTLPTFCLPLGEQERIEVQLIHGPKESIEKPFRHPHHSSTSAALVGGALLKPGEVTLAHRGILFLDELAEFPRASLEALREPLDSASITLSRASGHIVYPAQFQLCATTNPCPCGYRFSRKKPCRCNPIDSKKYLQKISGPLLDRFCLQVWLPNVSEENPPDIFGKFLIEQHAANGLMDFLEHFFTQQSQLATYRHEPLKDIHHSHELSLRAQAKIANLTRTFSQLFPQLTKHESFCDSIGAYRQLAQMWQQCL